MPTVLKPIITLKDAMRCWNLEGIDDLSGFALEGSLTISVVVSDILVEEGEHATTDDGQPIRVLYAAHRVSGVLDVFGIDIWPLFQTGHTVITRFKPEAEHRFIDVGAAADGATVSTNDLVVRRAEAARFAAAQGWPDPSRHRSRGGPGLPPRHDWDGFWIRLCRRVHEEGCPPTQAALVRELMDWFGTTHDKVPDPSTVKKKISRFWREFRQAIPECSELGS